MPPTPRTDVYQKITDQIVALLEQGELPWSQPWKSGHAAGPVSRPLRHNREPYHGINVLVLWATAAERGYDTPIWLTFKQAKTLGASVRKGQKGTHVVYAGALEATDENPDNGEETSRTVRFLKGYTVFNAEQIDGLPDEFHEPAPDPYRNPDERDATADAFFAALNADIRHQGAQPCYIPSQDRIDIPPFERFRRREAYYATLSHESVHWTRHPKRLDRDFGRERWGDSGYAREELVAELGAAYLCADLGLALELREDHAAYIGSWIKVLKSDNRAIFQAAAHAETAVAYLHGLQPSEPSASA